MLPPHGAWVTEASTCPTACRQTTSSSRTHTTPSAVFQVVPSELEAVLLTHPDVVDAGVFGLPDPQAGELPTALVVRAPGATATEKDIQDYVKGATSCVVAMLVYDASSIVACVLSVNPW